MNTKLKDRILWYDGDNTATEDQLCDLILQNESIDNYFVDEITENVKKFNLISERKLDVKYKCNDLDTSWNIPENYRQIDIKNYCYSILNKNMLNNKMVIERIEQELHLIDKLNLHNLFRCIIFILDEFRKNNIVWGVGRGSSCASYILYLFGLHKVDCLKYNVDAKEFFKIDK